MLTVFRRIRQKLLQSSRFHRYAIYAIGEILLVVVGILIALQINNWNEGLKENKIEMVTLSELMKNLDANILEMELKSEEVKNRINSLELILHSFQQDLDYHDSLSTHFGWAMVYSRVFLHYGAYESFKSSGSQVVKDDQLRFEISNHFDYDLQKLDAIMIEPRDDFYSYMLDYLRSEFKVFNGQERYSVPKDFEALKQNEQFKLSLGIFLDVQRDAFNSLNETKERSEEVKNRIEERLKKLSS